MDLIRQVVEPVVYGVVQGITEFLPISSSAHLRIVPALLGWQDRGAAFTAVIQIGTVAAMLVVFGADLWRALLAWLKSIKTGDRTSLDARIGWGVFVATIPISLLALKLKHYIEGPFRSLYVISASFIFMGLLMLVAENISKKSRKLEDVEIKDGLIVGLWQCMSLIPGMSRSGSTITGALFAGFDRAAAARFSFLMSVPSITLAGIFEAVEYRKQVLGPELVPIIIATVVSFVVGYAAIRWLLKFIQTEGIKPFVIYRVIAGLAILGLCLTGKLDPNEKPEAPAPIKAVVSR